MAAKKRGAVRETKHDEIGFWSEIKLDILKKYWPEYTKIVKSPRWSFHTLYIDAFAGSGQHRSRTSGEVVAGSPARALAVDPPFDEYHFIDLDAAKVRSLEEKAATRPDVQVHQGDCNEILIRDIYPRAQYEDYRRAVCLLDPYSLQLDWPVMAEAGKMKSVEIFLNFPIMDINRAVLRSGASPAKVQKMDRFWGDTSWKDAAYRDQPTLFGDVDTTKVENWELVRAFQERLKQHGGFKFVPEPLAMRNSTRTTVYYLFFAGNNETGSNIVNWIFNDYRKKGYG
ncbi:MAG TPA: three-Cys-motif partner protein TcmP [Thermoanaerobaculia bacterium]|nr:three-Cys-motif partner protein TcmP [Thermoanaerobaculia bacterium]